MPTLCDITITETTDCPLGGITQWDIRVISEGTIDGVGPVAGFPADLELATLSTNSDTAPFVLTNSTAEDIASAFSGTIANGVVVDKELLPVDVSICVIVTDPCGVSTESCDTAIVELIKPVAFFSSTWSTTYNAGTIGTLQPTFDSSGTGNFTDYVNFETSETDPTPVTSGNATITITTESGDTIVIQQAIGGTWQTGTALSSSGVFVGNEAAVIAAITGIVGDGQQIVIGKKTIANTIGYNYDNGTWTAANAVTGASAALLAQRTRAEAYTVTLGVNNGTDNTNTDNVTTLRKIEIMMATGNDISAGWAQPSMTVAVYAVTEEGNTRPIQNYTLRWNGSVRTDFTLGGVNSGNTSQSIRLQFPWGNDPGGDWCCVGGGENAFELSYTRANFLQHSSRNYLLYQGNLSSGTYYRTAYSHWYNNIRIRRAHWTEGNTMSGRYNAHHYNVFSPAANNPPVNQVDITGPGTAFNADGTTTNLPVPVRDGSNATISGMSIGLSVPTIGIYDFGASTPTQSPYGPIYINGQVEWNYGY